MEMQKENTVYILTMRDQTGFLIGTALPPYTGSQYGKKLNGIFNLMMLVIGLFIPVRTVS